MTSKSSLLSNKTEILSYVDEVQAAPTSRSEQESETSATRTTKRNPEETDGQTNDDAAGWRGAWFLDDFFHINELVCGPRSNYCHRPQNVVDPSKSLHLLERARREWVNQKRPAGDFRSFRSSPFAEPLDDDHYRCTRQNSILQ